VVVAATRVNAALAAPTAGGRASSRLVLAAIPVLFVLAALAVYLGPGAAAALVYDRQAILGGESWRLITGHWVHFSASHLGVDAALLGLAGLALAARGDRHFALLCVVSALVISAVILAFLPDMAFCGGLSGVVLASLVYLALNMLRAPPTHRVAGALMLLLCAGKLAWDAATGDFALAGFDATSGLAPAGAATAATAIVPVLMSHAAGAACGVLVYLWPVRRRTGGAR
jgi:rhomboid family GlyGly-CTERM serine protease